MGRDGHSVAQPLTLSSAPPHSLRPWPLVQRQDAGLWIRKCWFESSGAGRSIPLRVEWVSFWVRSGTVTPLEMRVAPFTALRGARSATGSPSGRQLGGLRDTGSPMEGCLDPQRGRTEPPRQHLGRTTGASRLTGHYAVGPDSKSGEAAGTRQRGGGDSARFARRAPPQPLRHTSPHTGLTGQLPIARPRMSQSGHLVPPKGPTRPTVHPTLLPPH